MPCFRFWPPWPPPLSALSCRHSDAPPATPLGGIRQREQVETGQQQRQQRKQCQETDPDGRLPTLSCHRDCVGDATRRKGDRHPAVELSKPEVHFDLRG